MFTLDSKVALVTGSARGIGRAIAEQLSAAGARLMLNDLDPAPLEETHSAIPGSSRLAGDITDTAFPGKLIQQTISELGGLDIIINNAGYTWDNTIQKTTDEQFQAMLDIHAVAPFRILRAAAPFIRESAKREAADGRPVHRKVVNITSIAGTDGSAGQAGYSSGKAAVIGLTRTMAKEWGRYNVNVNAVGFGLIDTRLIQPLTADSKIEVKGQEIRVGVQPAVLDKVIAASPLGRAGTVAEAAGAVLFFCSPMSDFVTGEVLMCAGGMHF
ncbi:MAG TPA: SDR family oxidoreductase [Bryobacteraceae bacterium]|jgi:3-oxoacyl-[acyl-carrier protein] reductase|nr:SDR family oxidoreductase [Bryobacteraceae bacterium]